MQIAATSENECAFRDEEKATTLEVAEVLPENGHEQGFQDEDKNTSRWAQWSLTALKDRFSDMHWQSPATMILVFLLGLACAGALHGYYSRLDGEVVGNTKQQQRALRIGTALAYFASSCFVGSITLAYIQCLWQALKRSKIRVEGVDNGFQFTQTLWAFASWEAVSKLRLAALVAFVTWILPLSTVIAPATLNVDVVIRPRTEVMDVPALSIADSDDYREFAYTVDSKPNVSKFLGPRTIMTRLTVATGANGHILQLNAPYANATYDQQFFAPLVKCGDADSDKTSAIDATAAKRFAALDPSVRMISNDYFAFVPALNDRNESASDVPIADLSDNNGASRASNQIWIRTSQADLEHPKVDVTQERDYRYLICQLYNASYHVNFTWSNGIQSISNISLKTTDPVPYPTIVTDSAPLEVNTAYSALFWALNSQIVGHLSFYQDIGNNNDTDSNMNANRIYSEISTNLEMTSLLGSSDCNQFFLVNHPLGVTGGGDGNLFSEQRLNDMAFARNRTLDVMIEELGFNSTIGLLTNPRFAPPSPLPITTLHATPIYAYTPRPLLLTYSLVVSFSLLCVLLGCHAYYTNAVAHDTTWSSIVCTTRKMHLGLLKAHERGGVLPLEKRVRKMEVAFEVPEAGREGSCGTEGTGGRGGSVEEGEGGVGQTEGERDRGRMKRRRSSAVAYGGFHVVDNKKGGKQGGGGGEKAGASVPPMVA